MTRPRTAIAIVVLAGATGFLAWRTVELGRRLDAEQRSRAGFRERTASLERALEDARGLLRDARDELRAGARERKALASEVRTRQRCNGPHLWLFPGSGPAGTRVEIAGDCFVTRFDDTARKATAGYGIFLIRQLGLAHPAGECELIAGADPSEIAIAGGRATGYLTIPTHGSCFQRSDPPYPLPPGVYQVGIGCHACATNARFRVTR